MPNAPTFSGLTPILSVADLPASMRYYVDCLGFTQGFLWGEPPTFASIRRNDVEIFFCQGGQGQPGMWMSVFLSDVDAYHAEVVAKGARIVRLLVTEPWGMREFHVQDLDGHTIRFGQGTEPETDLCITRTTVEARIEERLAKVIADLAVATKRTVGQVLEETLLHSFEAVPGQEGQAVASPHSRETLHLIDELKRRHGLDYQTHDSYRFREA